ncbi:MAG: class I SAM-dependent methyltransferase, partial [Dehalococcoidia bacterium]
MEIREYHRLREHERVYWWHVGKRALLSAILRWGVRPDPQRPGLDVGCGAGGNFALLEPYGRFFGSEVSGELYGRGRERPPRPVVLALGGALPLADESLGICTFFDVLEHVEDDDGFLQEIRRVLRPGGFVLVSVPAYQFLWSDHDVSLHHHRRYVRRTLTGSLKRNGYEVIRASYGFAGILPAVAVVRWITRLFPRRNGPTSSYVPTPR